MEKSQDFVTAEDPSIGQAEKEGQVTVNNLAQDATSNSSDEEPVHSNAQAGVQNIEAIASVWTTRALIIAYAMIWVIYFFDLMVQGVGAALTPYVTSDFQEHSLTPTVGVISGIISGVFKLSLAKVMDIFGRPQGFLISVIFAVVGLIMMAACNDVQAYAAANVFYTIGTNSLLYVLGVFVADTSSLRNRGLMTAFAFSPNIITTWIAGPMATAYLDGPGWRWSFGSFAITMPVITLPLFGLLIYNSIKAKKQGLAPKNPSQRTVVQTLLYYGREFDAIGLLLLSGGLALFLLPFNIYGLQTDGWRSPLIICLLVFGFVLLVVFVLWERFFAPITFIPYTLLLDRTVAGACMLGAVLFISFYCWNSYFSSFLQVVNDLDVTKASYVTQIYGLGSCLWSLAVGALIHYTGRFKNVCLYFGVPLHIFGIGLMIYFRQPDVNIGYIVMCQIFISFAGGTIIICDQIAAMAAASHQHIAVILAVLSMFSEIGGAIGLTVAASIWQAVFPKKLAEYLPASELPNLLLIYADLETQLSYPVGSDGRIAIQHAYADAQKNMLIGGTAIWALGLVATVMWRNIDVKTTKQVKGHVV